MEVPEFGSRAWVEQALYEILTQAREQATKFYETKTRESPNAVDLDAYSFIRISRRKRTLWRMLQDLSVRIPWLSVDPWSDIITIEPSCLRPWAWMTQLQTKWLRSFCVPRVYPQSRQHSTDKRSALGVLR
jgi:hypothetical protein